MDQQKTSKHISFANPSPYRTPPLGINCVEYGWGNLARVHAHATDADATGFNVNIDTNTTLTSGGCTWFDEALYDPDYAFGTLDTEEVRSLVNPQKSTSKYIHFSHSFSEPPRIVVWLVGFSINGTSGRNIRIRTYASEVGCDGFRIHIDTWSNTILYWGKVSWIAMPLFKHGVVIGKYSTNDIRNWEDPRLTNSSFTTFGGHAFSKPPKVYTGLASLDLFSEKTLRLKTWCGDVRNYGMSWHIDSWANSILYSAEAAHIAVE